MKKIYLPLVVAVAAIFSLGSCNKCQDCECAGTTSEVCEDDYASKEEYKAAIALGEALGCTCK